LPATSRRLRDDVNRAVRRAFLEIIDTMAGRASLQVSVGDRGLMPEELAGTAKGVAGVERGGGQRHPFLAQEREQLSVHGIDVTDDAYLRVRASDHDPQRGIDDPLVFVNQPDSIVLTESFAARHGLDIDAKAARAPAGRKASLCVACSSRRGSRGSAVATCCSWIFSRPKPHSLSGAT
jgi:hypothetical protein